jgi:hypothetical protein
MGVSLSVMHEQVVFSYERPIRREKFPKHVCSQSGVLVQGELTAREYDRIIAVPNGKTSIEHVIQQLVVELNADTIRVLDRSVSPDGGESFEPITDQDVPL